MLINIHQDFSLLLSNNTISEDGIIQFQKHVYEFYKQYKRVFPWRETTNPYHILVSEIMLQQTQVNRVISFYERFLEVLPNLDSLAQASQRDVLTLWSGLGYNRRALALHSIAQIVQCHYHGQLPQFPEQLQQLPGIGPNTAGSIAAFAFNYPSIFIETNIRTVFIHLFFQDTPPVSDKQLIPLIEKTLDRNDPRTWYYALMDYGTMLKKTVPNPSRKSKHYSVQSKFIGSNRRIRGAIIRQLTKSHELSYDELLKRLAEEKPPIIISHEQAVEVIQQLCNEKMITYSDGQLSIF